jgi:hypothetical protein
MSKKELDYFEKLLSSKVDKIKAKLNDNLMDNLFIKPKKDRGLDAATFPYVSPNMWHMEDTLFLPNDKGFRYCLVVGDVGSRYVDAEPLTDKTAQHAYDTLMKIYKRGIIKRPKLISVDMGKEFVGSFASGMLDIGVTVKKVKKGRHRAVSIAERKNQTIGAVIHKAILEDELETGEASSTWVERLPYIIEAINRIVKQKSMGKRKFYNHPISNDPVELLEVGQKVRIQLDEPQDITAGTRLNGTFWSSDIRWDPKIRFIKEMLLQPNEPVLYLLDGEYGRLKIEPTGYTRNQLQVVSDKEVQPVKILKVNEDVNDISKRLQVDKILNRDFDKTEKEFYYLIKWKSLPKSRASWEPKTELMKEIPNLIKSFDKIADDPNSGYTTLIPQKILSKKTINNRINYKVQYKTYKASEAEWVPRTDLIKLRPDLIKLYEDKNRR